MPDWNSTGSSNFGNTEAGIQLRKMERITAHSDNDFSVALYGSLWVAALSFIWIFCRADPEEPVKYVVEPPEQAEPGWRGKVLEKPALKVSAGTYSVLGFQLTPHRSRAPP